MSDNLSLLTEDLSNVPTTLPLLKESLYDLIITKVEAVPTKDGSGERLSITMKTQTVAESVTGETINAGFPIYHNIGITPTEKYSVEMIKRSLAAFAKAVGVATIQPLAQFEGKVVRVKLIVEQERTDEKTGKKYDARNGVKTFVIPG